MMNQQSFWTAQTLMMLLVIGCGHSLPELVQSGQWHSACRAGYEEQDSRFIVGEIFAASSATVQARVIPINELEELFPYVPAGLQSGRFVLIETELANVDGPVNSVTVQMNVYSEGHRSSEFDLIPSAQDTAVRPNYTEVGQWLILDGREEEWRQIYASLVEARTAQRERQERYSGPFGALRLLADGIVVVGSDLAYLSTLGLIDVHIDAPIGILSLRGVAQAVARSVRREPVQAQTEEQDLAQRQAETRTILVHLLEHLGRCEARKNEPCRALELHDTHVDGWEFSSSLLEVSVWVEPPCSLGSSQETELTQLANPTRLGAVFPQIGLR